MQPCVVNLLQAGPLPGCYQWHFKADEWSSYAQWQAELWYGTCIHWKKRACY